MKTNYFHQLTSSTTPDSNSISFTIEQTPPDQTLGNKEESRFISLGLTAGLMEPARSVLSEVRNNNVAIAAEGLIEKVESLISEFEVKGVEVNNIPKLRGYVLEDCTLQLEWASEKFRIGFSIEPNEQESGWYMVTGKDLGDLNLSGLMKISGIDKVLRNLVQFVVENT